MNVKIIKLQLLTCAVFTALLGGEWGYGVYAGNLLQENLQIPKDNNSAVVELPKFATLKFGAGDFSEFLERPLFNESRKPIVETPVDQAKQEENNAQLDDWSLIGVYNKNNQLTALFSKKNESRKYLKLTTNQQISGWVLKEIRLNEVILQQAGQQTSIQLRKPRKDMIPLPGARPASAPPKQKPAPPKNNPPETPKDDS
jgi:uncharacterized protein YxeA